MRTMLLVAGVLVGISGPGHASLAQAPPCINFQGRLVDGTELVNGNITLSVRLFDADTGGGLLYEDSNTVTVVDGLYATLIGDNTVSGSLADALTNAAVYVEVVANGVVLSPRERITSVPYALNVNAGGIAGTIADANLPVNLARLDATNQVFSGPVTFSHAASSFAGTFDGTFSGDGTGLANVDAETVDGRHAADFLARSGGTMTGALTLNTGTEGSLTLDERGLTREGSLYLEPWDEGSDTLLIVNNPSGSYLAHLSVEGDISGRRLMGDGSQISNVHIGGPIDLKEANVSFLEATGGVVNAENTAAGNVATGSYAKGFSGFATAIGDCANIGGWFAAAGDKGYGVYGVGWAETASTRNYGGYFEARAGQGRGVYAEAKGANGRAVEGVASKTGSYGNYGGYFTAAGNSGRGVYAAAAGNNFAKAVEADASNSGLATKNYGGHFTARGGTGVAVYGEATSIDGSLNYGGQFIARGSQAKAVYGEAPSSSGGNWGGYFLCYGSSGTGVEGYTIGSAATGVRGLAEGTGGVGVYGWAANNGDVENKGGVFVSQGLRGIGAWGSGGGGGYDFYAAGSGVNYGPFTGGHEVRLAPRFPVGARPGLIVSATGETEVRRTENGSVALSSTLPTVRLADTENDKAVFGVLVAEAPLPRGHWHTAANGERFATVNGLGEGRVWVTDANGSISAGDYITTSVVPGYGQRQLDDLLHSYTLGKATEAVDWNAVSEIVEIDGMTFKVYLLAVIYVSG